MESQLRLLFTLARLGGIPVPATKVGKLLWTFIVASQTAEYFLVFFSLVCFGCLLFVATAMPETKGKSFEQIQAELQLQQQATSQQPASSSA